MIGQPKYKLNETVSFNIVIEGKLETFTGFVYIIDRYGCFEDDTDVCYDIMVSDKKYVSDVNTEGHCLFKHINEKSIITVTE